MSHSTHTSGRKCISIFFWPLPSQASQRPPGLVEAEPPRVVAADLRLGQLGEQFADQIEDAGVGRRVRRRRVADRVLIDVDDLVDVFEAADFVVGRAGGAGAVQLAGERVVEHLVDQRTLARTADAGDGDERAERERRRRRS